MVMQMFNLYYVYYVYFMYFMYFDHFISYLIKKMFMIIITIIIIMIIIIIIININIRDIIMTMIFNYFKVMNIIRFEEFNDLLQDICLYLQILESLQYLYVNIQHSDLFSNDYLK